MKHVVRKLGIAGGALAMLAAPSPGAAKEITLQAVSCFPEQHTFSQPFEAFMKDVNEEGKGLVQINYVGGAPGIGSPFEVVTKLANGVYDIATCTGSYYANHVPEAESMNYLEVPPSELRTNGGFEYLQKVFGERNLVYLARVYSGVPFHLYLSRKIDSADLTGLHLRVAPTYQDFFRSLGATMQRSDIGQVYTYMENGTVHGYGWPVAGLLPDWFRVTRYRVDPGFYDANMQILLHDKSWERLNDEQKALLTRLAIKYEKIAEDAGAEATRKARALQDEKGIEAIELTGAEREKWLRAAREAGWAGVVKLSPEHGPKLREFMARE